MKNYFEFEKLGTNYRREIIGGLTTFLAMAYILAVNPGMLSLEGVPDIPDAMRMDKGAVFTATALAAAIGSILMGLLARYPIGLAPGMGLNAFFAFSVVLGLGIPWQTALTGVLFSGILFIILSLTGLREFIIKSIPEQLKLAVGAGIGLFITFLGLQNANIIVGNPNTLVALGDLTSAPVLLAIFGLVISVIMMVRKINGAIFYGMIITMIVGIATSVIAKPTAIVSKVPDISPTFGAAFEPIMNDPASLMTTSFVVVVITFLFVDFFDTAGTLVAVATQAGLMKGDKLPRAGKALLSDSVATVSGAILGTSTTTSFVESTAGVAAGARTGFASIVTGLLFILALFFSPILMAVTPEVTAPALIIVGALMVKTLGDVKWNEFEIAVPAFLTMIAMPLTYSIATGIAIGFVFYPITLIMQGRAKEIHPVIYGLSIIFILYFIFLK